ncbi:MAG: hypothetical protein ABIH39_07250 [Candidatus Margulisiibacteriota bacterium]
MQNQLANEHDKHSLKEQFTAHSSVPKANTWREKHWHRKSIERGRHIKSDRAKH